MGDQLLAVDDERVAGVGPATEARDDVGVLGIEVNDLALALVAPLGSDDHDDRHQVLLRKAWARRARRDGERCSAAESGAPSPFSARATRSASMGRAGPAS